MPSRRELIRMTPEEIRGYLEAQRRIILISNGADGLPHAVPMNYGIDAQGRILITSFARSQKVRNLERDPRATLLVESGARYSEMRAVMMYANAEIIRDAEQVREGMQQLRADGVLVASRSPAMDAQIRQSMAKRVLLRFTPFRYVSWDHAKLAGYY